MAMDPALRAVLRQPIRVAPRTGFAGGNATFGASVEALARVERSDRIIEGADGTKRQTTHLIITETRIGDEDRVWLPGEWTSDDNGNHRTPAIVDEVPDERGNVHHYEVTV